MDRMSSMQKRSTSKESTNMRAYKDSVMRRKRIESLCSAMDCSIEELLLEHRNLLSKGLATQARIMWKEKR